MREKAMDALAEARRCIYNMNRIAVKDLDASSMVQVALSCLENAETHLGEAKTYAVRAAA